MGYFPHTFKMFLLLLLTCFSIIELTSTQEGSSYYFYQQPEHPKDCKEVRDQCSSDNASGVYTIKPDGYPESFEVYCNNDISSGGWTVIQRRIDGSLTFNRNWTDYKSGFGFPSSAFWIGLDKLSYLTNQAVYELRIDMVLSNGSSFYVTHTSFRISDEWRNYTIVPLGEFRSDWACIVSVCPSNTTRDSCTCQNVCTDPIGQTDCYTNCVETCKREGCLLTETNTFISNGESFITEDCTQNCTCVDNQPNCNAEYPCSTDATCEVKDGIRKCYCNEGFEGDGETCVRSVFKDCYHANQTGHTTNGVYTIQPIGWTKPPFTVFCDMTTDGGGWTVFQRRIDGATDFYRDWNEYELGFGSQDVARDFWLGNEKIHSLTIQKQYKLRVDIVTSGGTPKYAEYTSFEVGDTSTKYQLSIGSYSGNAGNYLHVNNGNKFSTRDQDNDECSYHNYAEGYKSGWWFNNAWCQECYSYSATNCDWFETRSRCYNIATYTNLNGDYNEGNGKSIVWYNYNCNLNSTEMKIRPSSL